MKRKIAYGILWATLCAAVHSCKIENDIPYPIVEGNIESFTVEGQCTAPDGTAVTAQGDYLLYTAAKQPTLRQLWEALSAAIQAYVQAVESNAQDIVTRVDEYLAAHYADSTLTVQTMASDLGFVHTYLCNAYKKNCGHTINQKLTELRINRAKLLLADPSRKLYEVAHAVGYADGKYFVKLFTKEVGIPPKLYRENHNCYEEE